MNCELPSGHRHAHEPIVAQLARGSSQHRTAQGPPKGPGRTALHARSASTARQQREHCTPAARALQRRPRRATIFLPKRNLKMQKNNLELSSVRQPRISLQSTIPRATVLDSWGRQRWAIRLVQQGFAGNSGEGTGEYRGKDAVRQPGSEPWEVTAERRDDVGRGRGMGVGVTPGRRGMGVESVVARRAVHCQHPGGE